MEKPKIRFKGYQEDWEQRKLSELATMHARIGWQNLRTSEFLDAGDYMLITGTDFEEGKVNYSTCHYVEKERYDQDKNIQIKNGNILITKDGTLGKVAYVEGLSLPATLNAGVFNVEVKDENETDSKYLFQFLKAPFLMDYVSKKATGGTIKHLNQNILVDFPIATPSRAEQVRIGEYFSTLDDLITLHQRKCEEMKTLKKYMLQKMFPQNGQSVPQIRFSGFTEDWEQRKLSDVVDSVDTGKSRFDKEGLSGEYPILGSTSVIGYDDEYDYEGDFILTARVGANAGSLYRHAGKVKISDNTVFIQASQNIEFLYQLLIQFDIKKLSFGTGQPLVKASELKSLELMMPSDMKEQMRIGVYFKNLDSLITLHQQKCDELRNIKKFMLQNMFI